MKPDQQFSIDREKISVLSDPAWVRFCWDRFRSQTKLLQWLWGKRIAHDLSSRPPLKQTLDLLLQSSKGGQQRLNPHDTDTGQHLPSLLLSAPRCLNPWLTNTPQHSPCPCPLLLSGLFVCVYSMLMCICGCMVACRSHKCFLILIILDYQSVRCQWRLDYSYEEQIKQLYWMRATLKKCKIFSFKGDSGLQSELTLNCLLLTGQIGLSEAECWRLQPALLPTSGRNK